MCSTDEILKQVTENNQGLDKEKVNKTLIIFEESDFFIGDSCIMFDKFKACKLYFRHTSVDINFRNASYVNGYKALLKDNPNIDTVLEQVWEEIDYNSYDLILCATQSEETLMEIINMKHWPEILDGTFTPAIYSFYQQIIDSQGKALFPFHKEFYEFCNSNLGPMELFVGEEDQRWASGWLEDHGLKSNEKLLIMLDSTSVKSKLLKVTVYYELLMYFLGLKDMKILIYDEKNIGKDQFYKELVGEVHAQKFIFSNGLNLRGAISLLTSEKVRLIFGPCTGLMHCASGIYNHFLRNGFAQHKVPLMITYTGQYHKENENANYWWHNAPLMNCMIIRQKYGIKEMVLLEDLNEKEKQKTGNTLGCEEYTSGMLLSFLTRHLDLDK